MAATVYLIPSLLHEEGMRSIPSYLTDIVKQCTVLFVENERTTRRYLKKLDKEIVIDNYEWFTMTNDDPNSDSFRKKIKEEKWQQNFVAIFLRKKGVIFYAYIVKLFQLQLIFHQCIVFDLLFLLIKFCDKNNFIVSLLLCMYR